MLSKILEVEKVGRFERLEASRVTFTRVMLVFGENGWGKSTLADLLRSVTTGAAEIVGGRETLASAGAQKIRLLFERTLAEYTAGAWAGHKPTIAVYDQCFINDNVYSGDAVSLEHLKRQYGIVIGSTGVSLVRSIEGLSRQVAEFDKAFRDAENVINTALRTHGLQHQIKDFVALKTDHDIERLIAEKRAEIGVVEKSAEIGRLLLPDLLDVPTEASSFRDALASGIDEVAADAHQALHDHISGHRVTPAPPEAQALSHEAWIEAGLLYQTSDHCAFCGQFLNDRTLMDTYKVFFSAQYKTLAADVRRRRATLQRYIAGDFRKQLLSKMTETATGCLTWQTLTGVQAFELNRDKIGAIASEMEECAGSIDRFFEAKQSDLTESVVGPALESALSVWGRQRDGVAALNAELETHRAKLSAVREGHAAKNLDVLRSELAALAARRLRADATVLSAITAREQADLNKTRYTNERTRLRGELTAYSNKVAESLGKAINAYLYRLGAGFKIDYQAPNFRGKEPSASYHILINNVAVPPRSEDDSIAQPSFRNTLSTGDKSVLALAFFLASLAADAKLDETIVVLDDPFTSLDEFRRTFTANEIKKLTTASKQVIVLSHDKTFLRLLWERIDQQLITAVAIQTGAPGISTLTPFDISTSTLPRHVTERAKMIEFIDDTVGEPAEIRALLRKVMEHFYRQADPINVAPNETLDGIIRFMKSAPDDYTFKAAYDDLESINFYTRNFHHAPVLGSAVEQTAVEELKTYCRLVRDLTRGYAGSA
jgi:wobble nucleotide-excising tRNase